MASSVPVVDLGKERKREESRNDAVSKHYNRESDSDSDFACEAPNSENTFCILYGDAGLKHSDCESDSDCDFACEAPNGENICSTESGERLPPRTQPFTCREHILSENDPDGEETAPIEEMPSSMWIVGDSFVIRAAEQEKQFEVFLRQSRLSIHWIGVEGLSLALLQDLLDQQLHEGSHPPNILIIHLGGNDLVPWGRRKLQENLKTELSRVLQKFPQCHLIWSEIIPRRVWVTPAACPKSKNNQLRKISSSIRTWAETQPRLSVARHVNIRTDEHFDRDGVHLSPYGSELFVINLRAAAISISSNCYDHKY